MKSWQKIFLLFLLFILGCAVSYFFAPNYLANILLAYSLPVILNFLWLKREKIKLITFTLVTTIIFVFPLELASRVANSWDVQSIFPRIFGLVPLENILYGFINLLWVLSFYEYFVDHEKRPYFSRRWHYLIAVYALFLVMILGVFRVNPELVMIKYWVVGLFIFLLASVFIFKQPRLLHKIILPTAFFAIVFFIHEVISMKLGHWWWPGEYVWPMKLFGSVFPLDDVVIWYLLSTPALITGYEFFADDYK